MTMMSKSCGQLMTLLRASDRPTIARAGWCNDERALSNKLETHVRRGNSTITYLCVYVMADMLPRFPLQKIVPLAMALLPIALLLLMRIPSIATSATARKRRARIAVVSA